MHTSFYSWMQKRSEHWKILSKLTKLSQQKFLFKKTLPFVKLLQSIWFIDYALTIVTHAVSMMKNAENANGDGSTEGDYYISYRRRSPLQGDECATIATIVFGTGKKHIQIDSLWVFPHSPELIRKLHCHLHAELCISRIGSINYLFKYVCKGPDRVTVEISSLKSKADPTGLVREMPTIDEILAYQNARYISASEASWRLFSFPMVKHHQTVERPDVHLERNRKL